MNTDESWQFWQYFLCFYIKICVLCVHKRERKRFTLPGGLKFSDSVFTEFLCEAIRRILRGGSHHMLLLFSLNNVAVVPKQTKKCRFYS